MRVQRLVSKARAQGMLPNEDAATEHGRPQARQAAGTSGVGDNLREALEDVHTRDQPKASNWTSALSQDVVTGDGDIDPGLAFANVPLFAPGEAVNGPETISDPTALASLTGDLIAEAGTLAADSHRTGE